MSIGSERRKYLKSEARALLRYNYPKQVFMTGVVILIGFGLNSVKINIIKLLGLEYSFFSEPVNMFFDIAAVFVTLPLYMGIIYVNTKLFEGKNIPVGGMFYYFSSPANILDCYKFITALSSRFIAFALPFLITGALMPPMREMFEIGLTLDLNISADLAMLLACLIYIAAFFICIIIFMRYFASVFVFVKNPCLNVRDIFKKSAKLMKKRKIESIRFILSFTFWILLSHYLAGFLYIFFTLPYIMLSYSSYSSFLLSEKGGEEFLNAAYDYIGEPETISDNKNINYNNIKLKKIKRGEIFGRFKNIAKVRKKQTGG
ncbi:MAG: DUF975 family protein [Oscillospiraceae bacterium]|nr:DUF975 family protein [Oscillospiraceae bacterium]